MSSDNTVKSDNNIKQGIDLTKFACRFLENRGAALEYQSNNVTDALLPEEISSALGVEEYISLSDSTENIKKSKDRKLYSVQFQSPFLDKIVSMAGSALPFLQCELKFNYIKSQGFANLIKEQFEFHKSKIKITGAGEIRNRYLFLTCKFLAQSDEQKQGLFDLSLNIDTGAVTDDISRMIPGIEKEFYAENIRGYSDGEIRQIHKLVSMYGPGIVEHKLEDFVHSMNRRFKRDSLSLDRYYEALKNEMEESLSRTGISDKLICERQAKIDMIPEELAAKKKDLLNKYSIKISLTPVAALSLISPCIKIFANLISGNKKREISMIYNPVTKRMDPMVCRSCGASTFSLGMCGNMHLNCASCLNSGCHIC